MKRKHVNIVGLISSVLFLIALLYNQFIPGLFRWSALILGVLFLFVLIARRLPKIIIVIMSILMFMTSVFLVYTQYSAERILDYFESELNVVSFIVLKSSPIESLSDAEGKFFGTLSVMDKEMVDHIVTEVKSDFGYNLNLLTYTGNQDAMDALDSGNIEVLVLDDSIWEFMAEENPDFMKSVRVVHTISKEILKDDITKEVEVDKDSFVILISGIDTFGSINRRSRSDVNMLLVVNPVKGQVLMVSLPRDLYVPLACKNDAYDKLTHSGIYGINCTVQTIEKFLDIDINYYVRLNFTSFINIVDAMSGVRIYNEMAFVSHDGITFEKGNLDLDGTQAYHYVRERKAFEGGDGQRIQNQQKVLTAMIKKMLSPVMLTKIERIIGIVSKNIDTNISSTEISKLIKLQIEKGIDWEFASAYITGTDALRQTYSVKNTNLYVVIPDFDSLRAVQNSISDTMAK